MRDRRTDRLRRFSFRHLSACLLPSYSLFVAGFSLYIELHLHHHQIPGRYQLRQHFNNGDTHQYPRNGDES